MEYFVVDAIDRLVPDEWRLTEGFSLEVEQFNRRLLNRSRSDAEHADSLREWLRKYQPCIFGRIAAGDPDLVSFCILTERDLVKNDQAISDKIQRYRRNWKRQAYSGNKSAFVVAALLPVITSERPDKALLDLAMRLCELYLLKEDIRPDEILLDRIPLETTSKPRQYREWDTGVNFFSPQGDRRWWHDHRIPGGIVFSVNSVGHMAKSGARRNLIAQFEHGERVPVGVRGKLKIDSLGTALIYAMRTIANAQSTLSGKATCLVDLSKDEFEIAEPRCPVRLDEFLPPNLAKKDYRKYKGWYHTDVTIPSDYFQPDVARPAEIAETDLYFTYLFDRKEIAFRTMGAGVPG
jgi:hypothetical protein